MESVSVVKRKDVSHQHRGVGQRTAFRESSYPGSGTLATAALVAGGDQPLLDGEEGGIGSLSHELLGFGSIAFLSSSNPLPAR